MTFDFTGKTAVVTGASRGIGEAAVRQLDAGGARVALVSRSQDKLDAIAADLQHDPLVVAADLSDPDSVDHITSTVLDAFGGLDILVNNAAVERNQPAHKATGEAIDETLFVNLRHHVFEFDLVDCRRGGKRGQFGAIRSQLGFQPLRQANQ